MNERQSPGLNRGTNETLLKWSAIIIAFKQLRSEKPARPTTDAIA